MLDLSYRFEPGAPHDGVTAIVPLKLLPQLRPEGFDWLVPAFRLELVTALVRTLPKEVRRALVPVPGAGRRGGRAPAAASRADRRRDRPRARGAARRPRRARGLRSRPGCPDHLRMSFRVQDETGRVVAEGTDLEALRERARPRLRAALAAAARPLERRGMRGWELEALPEDDRAAGHGRRRSARTRRSSTRARRRRVRVLDTPGRAGDGDAGRHAPPAAAHDRLAAAARPGRARKRGVARAGGRPVRRAAARCSRTRCWRRSTRWSQRLAARRGTQRASRACAASWPASWRSGPSGRSPPSWRILDAARAVERALARSVGRAAAARRRDVAAQLGRLVLPGLRHRDRRRPARRRRALPAAPPSGAWSACPTPSPSTRTACAPSTSSRPPTASGSNGRR